MLCADLIVKRVEDRINKKDISNDLDLLQAFRQEVIKLDEKTVDREKPIELRNFPATMKVEMRTDGKRKIYGHGAVFESPSSDMGFIEIVERGAFDKTLKDKHDIKSFFNHNPEKVLGSRDASTLIVKVDDAGVYYEIPDVPDTTYANDLLISMERGDIRSSSFAFRVVSDRWEMKNGKDVRYLEEIELHELGPCTMGAYPSADSHMRSILETAGINICGLSEAFTRAQRGSPLEEEDRAIIDATIEKIDALREKPKDSPQDPPGEVRETPSPPEPEPEPVPEPVPEPIDEKRETSLILLRQRLELVEKQLI